MTDDFQADVIERLARIEERLSNRDDLPDRVMALENFRNKGLGVMSVLTAMWGYLFYHIHWG